MAGRRPFLAREILQSSGMDCGPASLTCLLDAAGIRVSYPRLRELCQTEVDGTSIDVLEEVAVSLGAPAEQVVVPAHHLLEPETRAFPSLAVSRLPDGSGHFVVLWRKVGRRVLIMDPAVGRRWVSLAELDRLLYRHRIAVEPEEWLEWASGDEFIAPLRRRLTALAGRERAAAWITSACARGARALSELDGAARVAEELRAEGTVRGSRLGAEIIDSLLARPGALPRSHLLLAGDEPEFEGCVLLRLTGEPHRPSDDPRPSEISLGDRADLQEPPPPLLRTLARLVRASGPAVLAAALVAVLLGGAGVVFEALLFRALMDIGRWLPLTVHRVGALGALAVIGLGLLLLDLVQARAARRLGRDLEIRFRLQLLEKLAQMPDPYFRSRLASDMAERGHHVHHLRRLPILVTRSARLAIQLCVTAAALSWISPSTAPWAWGFTVGGLVLCVAALGPLAARDVKLRTHAGALSRFYLDGLLGLSVLRAHGGERVFGRAHEGLLVTWARAQEDRHRGELVLELVASITSFSATLAIVFVHVANEGIDGRLLLVAWWALSVPTVTYALTASLRQLPPLRSVTLTLLELFTAAERRPPSSSIEEPAPPAGGAAGLSYRGVTVLGGGHTVLSEVSVDIAAGEHVAVLGASGAGKSSFLGVLLGIHSPSAGQVLIDGAPLGGGGLAALRLRTVWVAPEVALWNQSVLDNLFYGATHHPGALAELLAGAELSPLVAGLPAGLNTLLGEGGRSLSGGEGQRVRVGRGLARGAPGLVLLDEAFRGLDRAARARQCARIRAHFPGVTLIAATHDIAETAAFPRVLVFESGRLVESGAPAELAADASSHYARLIDDERRLATSTWESGAFDNWWMEGGTLATARPPDTT